MYFDFSADQQRLREAVRDLLRDQSPVRLAKQVHEDRQTHSPALWQAMREMGITALMLPESCGGHGLGALELCIAAEELGRQLSPAPAASTLYLAAQALLLGASQAQQAPWLTRIADGAIATLAAPLDEPATDLPAFDASVIEGEAALVPDALCAEFAVVLCRDAQWVVAELDASVERTARATLDRSRPWGRLVFNRTPAQALDRAGDADALLRRVRDRAAVLIGFEQLGGAEAATEMATAYARERQTFGRAIGSYQAIKHKLADRYSANQMARAHCYYGAWALANDDGQGPLPIAAAGARVMASRAFNLAAQENIQVHGGSGYTWEFDCHMYYRRARQLALMLGSEPAWSEQIAAELARQAAA